MGPLWLVRREVFFNIGQCGRSELDRPGFRTEVQTVGLSFHCQQADIYPDPSFRGLSADLVSTTKAGACLAKLL